MCSTVSYFVELGNPPSNSQSNAVPSASIAKILSIFFNNQAQAQTPTAPDLISQRWYMGKHRYTADLLYLLLLGAGFAFYFKFFKLNKVPREYWNEYRALFPEYRLWFLTSVIHRALGTSLILIPRGNDGKPTEITSLLFLLDQLLYFVAIFFYIKQAWRTLISHFWALFRDKKNNFDSSKFWFFFSRMVYILLADILLSAGALKLVELFPEHKVTGDNQKSVEAGFGKGGTPEEEKKHPLSFIFWNAFSALIIAPITEELIFRRVLFKSSSFHWSLIATSGFIFGLIHANHERETIFRILPYAVGGAVFAWTYWKYRNIWLCIFVHGAHNLISLLLLFLKGGGAPPPTP